MSGMAGNVTAFNTVWTYDIYQAYINKKATDAHYLWMGRMATIGGIVLSIGAAYAVTSFNNIMDALQLVFAIVNAPLFATFLLGMFWKRTTGHGAFTGLVAGTVGALVHHGLTLPAGDAAGIHGGWIAVVHRYPSDMAQNFWTAIFAFTINFVVTVAVSMVTRAAARAGVGRPRLLADAEAGGEPPGVVREAGDAGDCGAGDAGGAEFGICLETVVSGKW